MKWMIGILALATVSLGIAAAQDGEREKRQAEIKKLEQRAEKLLEQGRRAEAFDALARAAVLRDNLKGARGKDQRPKQKPKSKKANTQKKGKKTAKRKPTGVETASAALSRALAAGNMQGIRDSAMRLQRAAAAAETDYRSALAKERVERRRLEARLRAIEDQIAALKKALER